MGKDGNWRHRPRLDGPAGGWLYPVHSAALASEHFKKPRGILCATVWPCLSYEHGIGISVKARPHCGLMRVSGAAWWV